MSSAQELLHLAAAAGDRNDCHLLAGRVRQVLPDTPAIVLRRMLKRPEFELAEGGWRSCAGPLLVLTWRRRWAHCAAWWIHHTAAERRHEQEKARRRARQEEEGRRQEGQGAAPGR